MFTILKETYICKSNPHANTHTHTRTSTVNGFYCFFVLWLLEIPERPSKCCVTSSRPKRVEMLPSNWKLCQSKPPSNSLHRCRCSLWLTTLECFLWWRTKRQKSCTLFFYCCRRYSTRLTLWICLVYSYALYERLKLLCMLNAYAFDQNSVLARQTIACVFVFDIFHVEYTERQNKASNRQ